MAPTDKWLSFCGVQDAVEEDPKNLDVCVDECWEVHVKMTKALKKLNCLAVNMPAFATEVFRMADSVVDLHLPTHLRAAAATAEKAEVQKRGKLRGGGRDDDDGEERDRKKHRRDDGKKRTDGAATTTFLEQGSCRCVEHSFAPPCIMDDLTRGFKTECDQRGSHKEIDAALQNRQMTNCVFRPSVTFAPSALDGREGFLQH